MKVFWSWQSDTPGKIGRHFVRTALDEAIEELKATAEVDEPPERETLSELHLDHDRKEVPGSPDLARVILAKIENSAIFVADVTPIGSVSIGETGTQAKKLINSNVAIELGYALKKPGDQALLMVLNEHYGGRDDLPFDLRAKAGPITFNLPPNADKPTIKAAGQRLRGELKSALRLCIERHVEVVRNQTPFPAAKPNKGDQARFREAEEPLGILWDHFHDDSKDGKSVRTVKLANGPALFIRLFPISDPAKKWPSRELADFAQFKCQPPLSVFSGYFSDSRLRADDGFGLYFCRSGEEQIARSVVFVFETGEIWSVDTLVLDNSNRVIPFVEDSFARNLKSYSSFLGQIGLQPPYRWVCGITGASGYQLRMPVPPGHFSIWGDPFCVSNSIVSQGLYDGAQVPARALLPFFDLIFDKCGVARPAHLEH